MIPSFHSPKVFAITLNWNGKADTVECIASLKKSDYPNIEIIIVDNGSTDGSVSAIRTEFPDIIIVENQRNLGYAKGFNRGIEHAYERAADYFLILNNDTSIDPAAITELVKIAERDENIGFVTGKVFWYTHRDVFQTIGRFDEPSLLIGDHVGSGEVDRGQYDDIQDFNFVDDVFLLVRKKVFEVVGGYDPVFFLYYEETDWCARTRRAGFRIVYTPQAKIWHKGQIGKSEKLLSPKRTFYLSRYEVPFMRRNASRPQWRAYLIRLILGSDRIFLRHMKHGRYKWAWAYLKGLCLGFFWLRHDIRITAPIGRPANTVEG